MANDAITSLFFVVVMISIATVIKKAGCPVPDYMIGLKKIKRWGYAVIL